MRYLAHTVLRASPARHIHRLTSADPRGGQRLIRIRRVRRAVRRGGRARIATDSGGARRSRRRARHRIRREDDARRSVGGHGKPALRPRLHAIVNGPRSRHSPSLRLVEAHPQHIETSVGELRMAPPESDETPIPLEDPGVRIAPELPPVELGSAESLERLRVRHVSGALGRGRRTRAAAHR